MEPLALYKFDDFTVDSVRRQICHTGVAVPVPQKVFQLLLFLLKNPGRVLTKRELMDAVWTGAFVEEANLTQSIFLLRKALGEQPGQNRYIVTVPGQGYQFAVHALRMELPSPGIAADEIHPALVENNLAPASEPPCLTLSSAPDLSKQGGVAEQRKAAPRVRYRQWFYLAPAGLILLAAAILGMRSLRGTPGLAIDGKVVLADFVNTTGDPAFDAALRQGLAAQLEQSPNLGVLSDTRIAQTMKLMEQPKDARLSADLARQVCKRTGSSALIEGSIGKLGAQYVLGLRALQCQSGDTLAQDQETAESKEQVLRALGIAAARLRRQLGESLPSLKRYDLPPEDVTTGSLEALEAFGLGMQAQGRADLPTAVAFYKRAISYDPAFAMAYARLGVCDSSQNGVESFRKAYLLRDRVSDRERLYIESHYEQYATGNLAAARRILETWAETYPHDSDPGPNLLKLYLTTGEYERALPLVESIVKNSPGTPVNNASRLATTLLYLNRVDASKSVLLDAVKQHFDAPVHHYYLYEVYFLQNDSASMATEASFVRAQPGWNGNMLEMESISASYFGKFALARSLNNQAIQDALRDKDAEDAAGYLAEAALEEALAGNNEAAAKKAKAALTLSRSSGVLSLAGMAQALAGDRLEAGNTLDYIHRHLPEDTLVKVTAIIIQACALLGPGKTPDDANKALETLAAASPYAMSGLLSLVPIYVLGEAYLASGQSENAGAAFQNILDHYGITRNYVTGAVARLGLTRAEEQSGETAKAKADYAAFLHLWRDADANVPTLKAARASAKRLERSVK